MTTLWFCFLALMITVYVVLDGFDLGAGALHRSIAKNEEEREQITSAIGPVWNGNEVWLIAGGGVLFLAFPKAYASAFSGLYFGLIIVLWLLAGRGLALEFRHQLDNPLWTIACDTVFWLSSAALGFVFGVALGNVVRGVPLHANGYFHMPLFQILNWYALLVGLFGLVVLVGHGAGFLAVKGTAELAERARRLASRVSILDALLFAAMVAPTYAVRDEMLTNLTHHAWRLVFPALAVGALLAMIAYQRAGAWLRAFVASSLFIVGLLATMAAGLYPNVLPAHDERPYGLTIHNAASGHHSLVTALVWWPLGMLLAAVYFLFAYRMFFRTPTRSTAGGG